eukprot:COSAG02_NODE_8016_length_2745_cov_2.487906_1_plen_163_part_00
MNTLRFVRRHRSHTHAPGIVPPSPSLADAGYVYQECRLRFTVVIDLQQPSEGEPPLRRSRRRNITSVPSYHESYQLHRAPPLADQRVMAVMERQRWEHLRSLGVCAPRVDGAFYFIVKRCLSDFNFICVVAFKGSTTPFNRPTSDATSTVSASGWCRSKVGT